MKCFFFCFFFFFVCLFLSKAEIEKGVRAEMVVSMFNVGSIQDEKLLTRKRREEKRERERVCVCVCVCV